MDDNIVSDFAIDDFTQPEPYKFPYEDYQIIGDTTEIDKVIQTAGIINIDVDDITSTLSTDTLNYVTVGYSENIYNAIEQSVENMPIPETDVAKCFFIFWFPKMTSHICQILKI